MKRIGSTACTLALLLSLVLGALIGAAPARSATPQLLSVGYDGFHPTATFSARGAADVTVRISTRPDRATDGKFLTENAAGYDDLTDKEIASDVWLHEDTLDPGTYYLMLEADSYACPDGVDCVDGFSNVMTLTIPKPKQRYKATKEGGTLGSFTLTITPAGDDVPYKLCWSRRNGRKCTRGEVGGYSWSRPASDTIYLSADDLKLPSGQLSSTMTWYVAGKKVASKKIRLVPV